MSREHQIPELAIPLFREFLCTPILLTFRQVESWTTIIGILHKRFIPKTWKQSSFGEIASESTREADTLRVT
jgi:hypothetical protein